LVRLRQLYVEGKEQALKYQHKPSDQTAKTIKKDDIKNIKSHQPETDMRIINTDQGIRTSNSIKF
jgi:hypothetical protein